MTLKTLKKGEEGIIYQIDITNLELKRRLMDLGMTRGTKVRMIKTAPFGDPCVISLRGYELSIRKSDADKILIYKDRL